jgi:hypothetical protein
MGASEVRRVSRAEWRAYRATVRARYRENLKAHVLGQVAVSLTIGLLTGLIALLSGAGLSSAGFAVGGTGLYVLGAAAFYRERAPVELDRELRRELATLAPTDEADAIAQQRVNHLAQLNQAGTAILTDVDLTTSDYLKVRATRAEAWLHRTAKWIEDNYSTAERELFMDMSDIGEWSPFGEDHPIQRLEQAQRNLLEILKRHLP